MDNSSQDRTKADSQQDALIAEIKSRFDFTMIDEQPDAGLFAIVSWGQTATTWLARVLNSHIDIMCTHAGWILNPKLSDTKNRLPGLLQHYQLLADQTSTCSLVGDIHGVWMNEVPTLRALFGSRFHAAAITRDPIARLRSVLSHHLSDHVMEKAKPDWSADAPEVQEVFKAYDLPEQSYETYTFARCTRLINSVINERRLARVFRFEDVTKDTDTLFDLFRCITHGKFNDRDWIEQASKIKPTNSHVKKMKQKLEFEPWQQDALKQIVFKDAWDAYAQLGYELPSYVG